MVADDRLGADQGAPSPAGMPEWIEPTFRFTPGVDPIGIRALTAARIVGRLNPGVLALSDRARYLSFFAWLLKRYADQHRPTNMAALSRYLLAREYEFALAVRLCPNHCGASPVGMDRVGPAVAARPGAYERGESVKSDLGGYGLYYRTPMFAFNLVRPPGTLLGDEAIRLDVLNRSEPRAVGLAEAFGAAVEGTVYVRDYIDREGLIPEEVLTEYAARACLCRLGDFSDERALLRTTYLEPTPGLPPDEARSRRESFALFVDLIGAGEAPDRGDDALRSGVWREFAGGDLGGAVRAHAYTRWAALAATHMLQDGINLLWVDAGRRLRQADTGGGIDWETASQLLANLADAGSLGLPGGVIEATADRDAAMFIADLVAVTPSAGLVDVVQWARKDGRAIAGVTLILAVVARLPRLDDVPPSWFEIAGINGDWQPGLHVVADRVRSFLEDAPTLGETLTWLTEHLVIRPHESNAYSKLPDFTFRWRWEAGRLRFYDHPIAWDPLGDIRVRAMTSLLDDLGLINRHNGKAAAITDGQSFVAEVFAT